MSRIFFSDLFVDLLTYDFSEYNYIEVKNEYYKSMKGIKKYIAYKICAKDIDWKQKMFTGKDGKPATDNDAYVIYTDGQNIYNELKENYRKKKISIKDPDSENALLQMIYKCLWNKKHLRYCSDDKIIKGDTMNSVQTTLNKIVEYVLTNDYSDEYKNYKDMILKVRKEKEYLNNEPRINVSEKFIIQYLYKSDKKGKGFKEGNAFIDNKYIGKAEMLMNVYHTLGNFIPFPAGCNTRKSTAVQDYIDLTLERIYIYYRMLKNSNGDKNGKEIAEKYVSCFYDSETEKVNFIGWLNSFKNWKNFVEMNYLKAFVHTESDNYYPKELWNGHFESDVLPTTVEQCNEYFINASKWIMERSIDMLLALNDKGNDYITLASE